jgi:hypothetical protein
VLLERIMVESTEILDVKQAARLLTIHPVTLNMWRTQDRGPPYRRLPGSDRIVYHRDELLEWLAMGRVVPRGGACHA